jgi:AcrR family transcriptional regulator
MGSQQRRQRAKDDLRTKILTAAREIITEEGFDALTMRKLADRVEYSPASIYLHFRNREQIAVEVSRAGYVDFLAAISAAADAHPPADVVARFKALCQAYVRFGLEHPQTYELIFMKDPAYLTAVFAEQAPDDPATKSYDLLVQTAQALIATGHTAAKATPIELAETIWAAVHGIVSLKLTCPAFPTAPTEVLTRIMTETLLRGLSSPTPPPRTKSVPPPKKHARR